MRFLVGVACIAVVAAALAASGTLAQQSQSSEDLDKAVDDLLSQFGIGKDDPPPQPYFSFSRSIEKGRWTTKQSPAGNQFSAASLAETVSSGLDSAILQIDCMKGRQSSDPPSVEIVLGYWLAGRAFDGDQYSLDVFNSSGSGRPAGYDLGAGPVSTSHIDFSAFKPQSAPPEYRTLIGDFYHEMIAGPSQVVVFFETRGQENRVEFPTADLSDAMKEMQRFCPPF